MTSVLPFKIFVVEDNAWYGELLMHRLGQNPNHSVQRFSTARACLDQLSELPDFITLDYSLPDAKGEQVLRKIRERLPNTEVLVISGQEDVGTAVSMLRQGAYDYLVKDEHTLDRLWNIVGKVEQQVRLRHDNNQLRKHIGNRFGREQAILGEHSSVQLVHTLIAKAARTTITVSVSGETGTGKELVAKAIHFQSSRAGQPFVAVNMAAIPRELVESELFGHEKGAFTGAVARRVGRLEEANGGTLFLDEIADLDLSLQAKLLRVLQEREVTRVGGNQAVEFDVRLIVATHRDLLAEVEAGRFREDLYYRLLGLPIVLPPLRQRGNDVLLLAEAFVRNFCALNNLPLRQFTTEACDRLLAHPFPGNVRELKAVVELATVLADGEQIQAEDLPLRAGRAPEDPTRQLSLRDQTTAIVQNCLDEMGGDVLAVAARLRIGKSTVYRMIQQREVHIG
ncbi:sigma-54-dependent transcriptional regulator [Hymenobacter arizonensis]|uniref:DNA-binding transcriptional response regulator, NtrC family, contains REC, AAA-type ATPase, and a Fis-type DNA-binding domains n=1 Tax=Hymenobacter arizonensis TaxID=1227077 RepID=A0A1I6AFM5_HYMAR|nr:sigma-54 dependent transcriptional regulator [Hymenobacter arizonensis]SFQ67499.1 DNA-binding transcriptional response regulator, NtrC family, contains REC, AAA-type ATPase, and a Fis-type DNA-binding domains [Hymenobacter arizonensis]